MVVDAVGKLLVDGLGVERRVRTEHGDKERPRSGAVVTKGFNERAIINADCSIDHVEQSRVGRAELELSLLEQHLVQVLVDRLKSHVDPSVFVIRLMSRVQNALVAPWEEKNRRVGRTAWLDVVAPVHEDGFGGDDSCHGGRSWVLRALEGSGNSWRGES